MAATAAGVVAHKSDFGVSDHSVCGAKWASPKFFLMPQATPPHEEGTISAHFSQLTFMIHWGKPCSSCSVE